jgi:hypothetical protein
MHHGLPARPQVLRRDGSWAALQGEVTCAQVQPVPATLTRCGGGGGGGGATALDPGVPTTAHTPTLAITTNPPQAGPV